MWCWVSESPDEVWFMFVENSIAADNVSENAVYFYRIPCLKLTSHPWASEPVTVDSVFSVDTTLTICTLCIWISKGGRYIDMEWGSSNWNQRSQISVLLHLQEQWIHNRIWLEVSGGSIHASCLHHLSPVKIGNSKGILDVCSISVSISSRDNSTESKQLIFFSALVKRRGNCPHYIPSRYSQPLSMLY